MEKPCRRRKIEFVKDSRARDVTFVKRRGGLFRKASELAILCGAQCAIITVSERGTPFVFGHPSADAVINRFVGVGANYGDAAPLSAATAAMEEQSPSESVGTVESWKKRKLFCWDEELIDDMKVEELELYTSQLRELRKKVKKRMEEMMVVTALQTPETKTRSSSNLGSSSSSSCCDGSRSSAIDDDYNNVFDSLDELVPPRLVISNSNGDDLWKMMMMESGQEEEDKSFIHSLSSV